MTRRLVQAGHTDEAKLIQHLAELGLISHDAGQELEVSEIRKNMLEKGLGRAAAVASAIPTAIENINRASTGIAAYRMARNPKLGNMTHEQALNHASDAVNDTQGDYSQAVAPEIFKSPIGRMVLQFKKYPQMIMRLITRAARQAVKGDTPQERKQGRKELIGLSITHGLMAGAAGCRSWRGPSCSPSWRRAWAAATTTGRIGRAGCRATSPR
jgi:hypothetical protein